MLFGDASESNCEQSGDIIYDPNLVQQLFLRTFERDIVSPYVLREIKPHLKPESTDESLTTAVTRVSAAERDREEYFSTRLKKARGV